MLIYLDSNNRNSAIIKSRDKDIIKEAVISFFVFLFFAIKTFKAVGSPNCDNDINNIIVGIMRAYNPYPELLIIRVITILIIIPSILVMNPPIISIIVDLINLFILYIILAIIFFYIINLTYYA